MRTAGTLDANAFEAELRALVAALGKARENEGSVECARCRACVDSTFCQDSDHLARCHYCVACSLCTDSSHCRRSRAMIACTHCMDSESCVRCSYVVRATSLVDCTYCFGCVGLAGKDFHVLNEPCDRKTYFALTERLARELGLSRGR